MCECLKLNVEGEFCHPKFVMTFRAWYAEAKKGNWSSPHEIKHIYGTASAIGNERIVFNICGNKYRLVVAVKYEFKIFYIRFIGTHRQYDEIDVKEV